MLLTCRSKRGPAGAHARQPNAFPSKKGWQVTDAETRRWGDAGNLHEKHLRVFPSPRPRVLKDITHPRSFPIVVEETLKLTRMRRRGMGAAAATVRKASSAGSCLCRMHGRQADARASFWLRLEGSSECLGQGGEGAHAPLPLSQRASNRLRFNPGTEYRILQIHLLEPFVSSQELPPFRHFLTPRLSRRFVDGDTRDVSLAFRRQ